MAYPELAYIRELIDTLNCKMKFLHDNLVSFGRRHVLKADAEHTITPMSEIDYKRIATTITTAVADSNANLSAKIDEASGIIEEVKAVAVDTNSKVTPKPKDKPDTRYNMASYFLKPEFMEQVRKEAQGKTGAALVAVLDKYRKLGVMIKEMLPSYGVLVKDWRFPDDKTLENRYYQARKGK